MMLERLKDDNGMRKRDAKVLVEESYKDNGGGSDGG